MHARYPDWDIAFMFYTKSLYQIVRTLIEQRYSELTDGGTPTWQKLTVWHAWGETQQTGFYREAATIWGARFIDYGRAQGLEPGDPFGYCCTDLEKNAKHRSPFLDAAIIDAGQDLPPAFYRLVHSALRDPKRLYWAYDEAQGIGNLTVPRAEEIFGRDDHGRLSVDLKGNYTGGNKEGAYHGSQLSDTHGTAHGSPSGEHGPPAEGRRAPRHHREEGMGTPRL
ncbi:MAG: hypothetical protein ACREXS_09080 [Gammaproteobacteria bacterium]